GYRYLKLGAVLIFSDTDFRGCVIEPEIIHVGDVANGWRESLQYCREQNMDLICFSSEKHRLKVNRFISENHSGLKDLWIGMRRSSLTGAWYWVSDCPLVDTSWAEGEPGQVQDGHCVMMEKDQEFTWRDEACCKAAQPVCNSPVLLFPI
uniref:C-type lectin domain-containing protein n=1 Tax=Gouania willdenowi TaxID=441366 RepID=A0A8C5DQK1_GOUWI